MLEREREPGADGLEPGVELAALGARDALEPERAGAQVDAPGALRLLAGDARELDRLAVLARALQVAGDASRSAAASPGRPSAANASAATRRAASARSRSPWSS